MAIKAKITIKSTAGFFKFKNKLIWSQDFQASMVAKKKKNQELKGKELVKEVCRRIRVARSYWGAHNNAACRGERDKAIALYNTLTPEQKEQISQQLRIWLRYRSEKYFGENRTAPKSRSQKS